jgi:hypothetical protein
MGMVDMSYMIEVFYREPSDPPLEAEVLGTVKQFGGEQTCKEVPKPGDISRAVCLTIEFDDIESAEAATLALENLGRHVEGPVDYGD